MQQVSEELQTPAKFTVCRYHFGVSGGAVQFHYWWAKGVVVPWSRFSVASLLYIAHTTEELPLGSKITCCLWDKA